jgi:hypothetical protein
MKALYPLVLVAVCAAPQLAAQDAMSFATDKVTEPTMMMAAPPPLPLAGGDTMSFMQFEMTGPVEVVAGKPYAASLTVEVLQPLVDGNSITVEHHSRVFRDAQGRTRRDDELGIGGVVQHSVLIADPIAGTSFTLDPERRVAQRLPQAPQRGAQVAFAQDLRGTAGGASTSFDVAPPSPLAGDKPAAVDAALHPAAAATFSADTPIKLPFPGDPHSVSLGEKTIEGVRVSGTRTTVTIPAAAIGNRAPIEIVTEQWYSPELNVVMLSEHRDPRVGQTRYRLHDITRSEPDAALFRVPAGYSVSEASLNPVR